MQIQAHQIAHVPLLIRNWERCIHYGQAKFLDHSLVLTDNTLLKQLKTFLRIGAQPQIHTRLIILEFVTTSKDATERNFQWHAVIEGQGWFDGELVEFTYPLAINIASCITGKSGVNIAISEHNSASF